MTNEQTIEDRATQPLKRKAEFRKIQDINMCRAGCRTIYHQGEMCSRNPAKYSKGSKV